MDLLRLLLLQRDDVVVDVDGAERFEVETGAAGRRSMDEPGDRPAMLRAHDDDEAAIALGDDLVLQVLRRVPAAQVRLQRAAQPLPLPAQLVAQVRQRRTRIVHHLAVLTDGLAHAGVLVGEPRGASGDGSQGRQSRGGAFDERRRAIHRFEEVRERQQAKRFERRACDDEPVDRPLDGLVASERQRLVVLEQQDGLAREVEGLRHADRLGGRRQAFEASGTEWRDGVRTHHGRDLVELECAECGGLHGWWASTRRGPSGADGTS